MLREIRPALVLIVALTVITGLVYPLAMTGIAQAIFPRPGERQPDRAGRQGRRLGADRPDVRRAMRYFHGRPSAAGDGYNAAASSGSNLGPTNAKLIERVKGDVDDAEGGEPERAGAGRPRHHLGQRPRPGHLAGAAPVPGAARRQGAQPARRPGASARCRQHPGPVPRPPRRAARQRARAQPRARPRHGAAK